MKIILLSGGEGKRLWPLSAKQQSKPLLPLLRGPSGEKRSMLQQTVARLQALPSSPSIYIATSDKHLPAIHRQVGESIPCLAEPAGRDTFPAISLAASYLSSKADASRDEVIVVVPVDSGADARFFDLLPELETELLRSDYRIGLVGVKPHHPSDQYGYLRVQADDKRPFRRILGFTEKPDRAKAEQLLYEGALWNGGIFAFKLGYLLELLEERGFPSGYDELLSVYSSLPARSFDYEVVEQEEHLGCLVYDGEWSDLGSWTSVSRFMDLPSYGKVYIGEECQGTHALNELPIPLVVSDLQDAIVVAGPEGILVSSKRASDSIKEVLSSWPSASSSELEIHASCEERLLDELHCASSSCTHRTRFIHVPSGHRLESKPQAHRFVWNFLQGNGIYTEPGSVNEVRQGDSLTRSLPGSYLATADTSLIEITTEYLSHSERS